MNRMERFLLKAKRKVLREQNAKYRDVMVPVPREEWPDDFVAAMTLSTPMGVWRSCRYLAVLYEEPGKRAQRLSIVRTLMADDGRLEDGLSWDELQRIKGECGFGEVDAVEIYPRDVDIVNVSNMRHLWILPEGCEWTWRS